MSARIIAFVTIALALGGCGDDDSQPPAIDHPDASDASERDTEGGTDAVHDEGPPGDTETPDVPDVPDDAPEPDTDTGQDDVNEDADVPIYGLEARVANATCLAPSRPAPADQSLTATRAFEPVATERPVAMTHTPSQPGRFYLADQSGRITTFHRDAPEQESIFLDLRGPDGPVGQDASEKGLLGLAFHPSFADNGEVYVSYTTPNNTFESRVSRFVSSDGLTADPDSEVVILTVAQTRTNHNGGNILFGPDGYLYLGLGDGGGAGDPDHNGQNTDTLLGSLLRIDVDSGRDAGALYQIPADNPFAAGGGAPEIFAYGLRNPWRYSFDSVTGQLWLGDVGQAQIEEVNIIASGGNYGWPIFEGSQCYDGPCDTTGTVPPVFEYDHGQGDRAIAGGFVYRGAAMPFLFGRYVFGDLLSGRVWALAEQDDGTYTSHLLAEPGFRFGSFAEGPDGELYLLSFGGGIQELGPVSTEPSGDFPTLLSQTGCFDADDPTRAVDAAIPYDLNTRLWSDGASKRRWLAIPDGETIDVLDDGDFAFPIGTVLLKEFSVEGHRVETRLLVRHDDGRWAGYAYAWRADESDAELVDGETVVQVAETERQWTIPSRAQCLGCHTEAAGRSVGPELANLNRDLEYPSTNIRANQLATMEHIGLFSEPLAPVHEIAAYPEPTGNGDLAQRARSYLQVNCAHCHRPGGPGRAGVDFRYTTPLDETGACNATPESGNLGIDGARLIVPGDPSRSLVSARMRALDGNRMPALGTAMVDTEGVAVIDAWISSLASCQP